MGAKISQVKLDNVCGSKQIYLVAGMCLFAMFIFVYFWLSIVQQRTKFLFKIQVRVLKTLSY